MIELLKSYVGLVGGTLNVLKTLRDFVQKTPRSEAVDPGNPLMVAKRLVKLFDAHGVKRSQIPKFFGHGLSLEDLRSDESLLAKLDDGLLDDAAQLFAIRREWLDGESERIFPIHRFYKRPELFAEFLAQFRCGPEGVPHTTTGLVLRLAQPSSKEMDTLFLLEEQIGWVGDRPISRLHICDTWVYKYWKCRAHLAACVAIAWSNGMHVMGRDVEQKWLIRFLEGNKLFMYDYEGGGGFDIAARAHWHPEDLALRPEVFLTGFDEEYEKEGGLNLWLRLDDEGWMSLGDKEPFISAREKFEIESQRIR